MNSAGLLTTLWTGKECLANESLLDCQYRLDRPSFAFIAIGTNEAYYVHADPGSFERNMRLILDDTLAKGILPILGTKADDVEGDGSINATIARLNSYKQYWNRINHLIEEGKYSRDRFKMELHQKQRAAPQPAKEEAKSCDKGFNLEVETIYHKFIEARNACHLPISNITHEMIAAAIEKQKPVIINKFKCSTVEFKVVIEEGVPKIKARPKL